MASQKYKQINYINFSNFSNKSLDQLYHHVYNPISSFNIGENKSNRNFCNDTFSNKNTQFPQWRYNLAKWEKKIVPEMFNCATLGEIQ